jgi:riboflavin kinase/FMN adenylyltransferase
VWQLEGERVSSTLVRRALLAADLPRLERLLGRRFSLLGRVIHGNGRGRDLGFPTANLDALGGAHPPPGVYFAEASLLGPSLEACLEEPFKHGIGRVGAVVNIGTRPTFHERAASSVEAHLVGWNGDLYGKYVELFFLARHRDEQKFPSVEALTRRIRGDIEEFERFRAAR